MRLKDGYTMRAAFDESMYRPEEQRSEPLSNSMDLLPNYLTGRSRSSGSPHYSRLRLRGATGLPLNQGGLQHAPHRPFLLAFNQVNEHVGSVLTHDVNRLAHRG